MLPMAIEPTTDLNFQRLRFFGRERLTGVVGVTLTLSEQAIGVNYDLVFKNGLLLDPGAAYTIADAAITLAVAAIAGDVFVVWYYWHPRR